jgi:hypothetical protein
VSTSQPVIYPPCNDCPRITGGECKRNRIVSGSAIVLVIMALAFSAWRMSETSRFLNGIDSHLDRMDDHMRRQDVEAAVRLRNGEIIIKQCNELIADQKQLIDELRKARK